MLRLHDLAYDHPDYPTAASHCRDLIWDTAVQVLYAGIPVVLDWNLWSRERRSEWVVRAAAAGSTCILHYLEVPLQTAINRAQSRTEQTAHKLSGDAVRHLAHIFEPPSEQEGFTLHRVTEADEPDPPEQLLAVL